MVKQEIVEDVSSYDLENIRIKSKSKVGKSVLWKVRTHKKERVYIPLKDCMINHIETFDAHICKVSMNTDNSFKLFVESLNRLCESERNYSTMDTGGFLYAKYDDEFKNNMKQLVNCVVCIEGVLIIGTQFTVLWSIDNFSSSEEYAAPDILDIEEIKNELMRKIMDERDVSKKNVSKHKKEIKKHEHLIECLELCGYDLEEIENVRNQVNE